MQQLPEVARAALHGDKRCWKGTRGGRRLGKGSGEGGAGLSAGSDVSRGAAAEHARGFPAPHLQPGSPGRQEGANGDGWARAEVLAGVLQKVATSLTGSALFPLFCCSAFPSPHPPRIQLEWSLTNWKRPCHGSGEALQIAPSSRQLHEGWPAQGLPANRSVPAALTLLSTHSFPGTVYLFCFSFCQDAHSLGQPPPPPRSCPAVSALPPLASARPLAPGAVLPYGTALSGTALT